MVKILPLSYTRPKWVDPDSFKRRSRESLDEKSDGSIKSGTSGHMSGIPESLGFDKIINGGTCPVRCLHEHSQPSADILLTRDC